MSKEKFSRSAAISSQVIIVLWLAVQLLTSVFQQSVLMDFVRNGSELPKVNSWKVIALCAGGLCITAANFMICQKKGKKAPLIMSAVSTGLLPAASKIAETVQFNLLSGVVEEYEALSVYSVYIIQPLSYLLYAGAFVTAAAAAVYALGDSVTFPRKASIVSQTVIIVWTALQLLSSVFQKRVIGLFITDEQAIENAGKVTSYAAIALCFGGLFIIAANFLICQKKGKLAPLIMSAVAAGLTPIISARVNMVQKIMAGFKSLDTVYVFGSYSSIVGMLSYLLYVGAALAIAAAAAYLFEENKDTAEKGINTEIKKESELL